MPFAVPLDTPVADLAAGQKQKVEILRQLYLKRNLLILDEPTSVLTPDEADEVLSTLKKLTRRQACSPSSIITHKFREVNAFCDDVTVLRRGKLVGTQADRRARQRRHGRDDGRPARDARRRRARASARRASRCCRSRRSAVADNVGQLAVEDLSLDVRAGEIVGVAGVSGNGQRELVEALAGQRHAEAGRHAGRMASPTPRRGRR